MSLTLLGAGPETGIVPFDPSSISGLDHWWKADAITGLNDGDAVSSWPASAGASAMAQVTGSKQPLYKTNIQNGKPAVLFDGVDDFLVATITSRATASVFMALRITSTTGDFEPFYTSGGQEIIDINVGGFGLGIYGGAFVGGAYVAPVAWTTIGGIFAGTASSQFRRNGSATTGDAGSASSSTSASLASNSGTSRFMGGYIGEVLRYSGVLANADILAVESYLKTRWATP